MINFDFKNSNPYKSVCLSKNLFFRSAKSFRYLSLAFCLLFFFWIILDFVTYFDLYAIKIPLGLLFLSLAFYLFFSLVDGFYQGKIKNPPIPDNARVKNLADLLDFNAAQIIFRAEKLQKKLKISSLNATLVFYSILKSDNSLIRFLFSRLLLNNKELAKYIEGFLKQGIYQEKLVEKNLSEDLIETIETAIKIARRRKHKRIFLGDLLIALSETDKIFNQILDQLQLHPEDMKNLVEWYEFLEKKQREKKKFWSYKNLLKKGSLAKDWAVGYTITLDEFALDWTKIIKQSNYPEIIGYEEEIDQLEHILASPELNNALIIGEPGVGIKNIIRALAKKSALGLSLSETNYKRVVELQMSALLAKAQNLDEAEELLQKIFSEVVAAGNVILVIDEFHNYVGRESGAGALDITSLLVPYLRMPQFPLITLTSYMGLHRDIEQNPSLLNYFVKIEVKEPSAQETQKMLEMEIPELESKYKKYISYQALKDLIKLSEKFITNVPFPKKAQELLEEAFVKTTSKKQQWIMPEDIAYLVTQKTEIPVGKLEKEEKQTLLNLEELIHRRIINQNEAVKEVSSALRRARAQIVERKKPMGSFLFLGPTGVGKTETAKALAEIYFGSEEKIIRLDMSEFQNIEDIPRLIGGPENEGLLTTPVRENPFSLVLLDEIEKAHLNILNLFLQVLDEGHITDGLGRKIDFRNTIIIATSNAGYKIILKALEKGNDLLKIKQPLLEHLFQEGTFRPELVNRFDAVVLFRPLSKKNLLDIAQLMLNKIKKGLEEKRIEFVITEPLKERVVELGYNITFGARNMKRVIQDKIEDAIAQALLKEELKPGTKFQINPEDFSIEIL
ncbi:ATP-dependent Clp protease ATP-binding subunit [bacterium]|nr:ATP-dependent Clp protease ATP-binding subunit [bacterium]